MPRDELARPHDFFLLVQAFRTSHPPLEIRRAASWMLWLDGRLADLDHQRPSIGPDAIAVAKALKLCHDAGIDVRSFRIWQDAARIRSVLPPGDLASWLGSHDLGSELRAAG